MSSRFSFRHHVRDIENSSKSPHSNCSNHSTPQKQTPHSTSVSPHTTHTPNNSISLHFKPPSHLKLKILLPEIPSIASRDSIPIKELKKQPKKTQQITHLTVPSDSDNFSSPLLSEPSPEPASPIPLTLNRTSLTTSPKSTKSTKSIKSTTSPLPYTADTVDTQTEITIDTAYNYPASTTTNSYPYSSYPVNQSPVSTTSTYYDNLTPLYTAHILELTQSTTLPDLCLAPLNLVISPTPLDYKLNSIQIQSNPTPPSTGTHFVPIPLANTNKKAYYLSEANRNYNYLSDSDYDYNSDPDIDNILQTDIELEQTLITMGSCCSEANEIKNTTDSPNNNINTDKNTNNLSIPLPDDHNNNNNNTKLSFTDKFFRSTAQINAKNNVNVARKQSSPKNGSVQHSDDDFPPIPIPNDADSEITNNRSGHKHNFSNNLTLLSSLNPERVEDQTDTRTYNTLEEQRDIVSPIMPALDKITSIPTKRPSTSALSSPLHSVRLSITPRGHLAPIHIMDNSDDDDDEEDNSFSTTDSKEDKEYTKYSEINTPIEFLKKHQTITKFVSKQISQTSDKNLFSRRKRRPGVSERHTLTFSKPPIPMHELPQSPKFAEINLDVFKPRDFLHKILVGNLLFSGVDPEFSEKMVTKVVDLMRAADFDVDEILMNQGEEGDAFYAVEYGIFDILVSSDGGDFDKVAVASKGDCVGEYALLYNQPRTATLKATTAPCRVWGITAEQFASMRQEIMDWNVKRFERRQEFIHSIPLFQKLEQHELLNMTHACHAEIYDINEYIIKPNEVNTNVYIIMEGTVMISYDKIVDNDNNENENDTPVGLGLSDMSSEEQIELIPSNPQSQLQLQLKMSLTNDDTVDIQQIHDGYDATDAIYHHPRSNNDTLDTINTDGLQLKNISDPPMLQDIDNNVLTINLNNQSAKPAIDMQMPFNPLSLRMNSANSAQSVHSIAIIGGDPRHSGRVGALNIGGDKELGACDYFAKNLFVNQYEDYDEEELVCARAHTRCKVLKIARDDFVLIMAAKSNAGGSMMYLFNDSGVINGDGELPDNKQWKNKINGLKLTDLEERDVLGIGSFGKVTLVENKNSPGMTYALKCVSKYRVVKTGQEEHIINEKRVLTMLDSPFCIKLFATFKTESTIYFLTEVVLGGELFTVLRYNEKFDKNATRFYAGCVILALEHLHSMDIIYRDLKPENLLLNSEGYLQLTDFGFAKRRNTTCTLCGTPQYLAPEVIHNWVQSFATDWWALGVLLYEMVVGHPPFEDDENIKMYEKILIHEPEFPSDINSKLRHLIQKLLEKNAYQRLGSGAGGARQVKQHPFFKNKLIWQDLYEQKLEPPYKPNIVSAFDTGNFDHFSDYEESEDEDEEDKIDLSSPHFQWADHF